MTAKESLDILNKKYGIGDSQKAKEPQATQSAAFGTSVKLANTNNDSGLEALNKKFMGNQEPAKVTIPQVTFMMPEFKDPFGRATDPVTADQVNQYKTTIEQSKETMKKDYSAQQKKAASRRSGDYTPYVPKNREEKAAEQEAFIKRAQEQSNAAAAKTQSEYQIAQADLDAQITDYNKDFQANRFISEGKNKAWKIGLLTEKGEVKGEYDSIYRGMTDAEKNEMYYLLGKTGNADVAKRYMERLKPAIVEKLSKETTEKAEAFAKEHPILGAAGSIGESALGGITTMVGGAADTINSAITGKPLEKNEFYTMPTREAMALRTGTGEAAAETMENMAPAVTSGLNSLGIKKDENEVRSALRNIGSFGSGLLIDSANSIIMSLIPGGAALLGTSAATSGFVDALDRGANFEDALLSGTVQGIFEGFFEEHFTLSNLRAFQAKDSKSIGRFLFDVFKSQLANAGEEINTEAADKLADLFITGDYSELKTNVAKYMNAGLSQEDAWKRALTDAGTDIAMAGLGGFLSAGVSGVFSGGIGKAKAAIGNRIENRIDSKGVKAAAETDVLNFRKQQEDNGKSVEMYGTTDQARQVQFREAELIANRFGKQMQTGDMVGSGSYKDGTITINTNTTDPVMDVLIHELTHGLEQSSLYGQFSSYVLNYITTDLGINIEDMKKNIIKDYSEIGQNLDDAGAQSELIAKFAAEMLFSDQRAIDRMYNTNPTLFERVYYAIQDMRTKLKGTDQEKKLAKAESLYQNALKNGNKSVETQTMSKEARIKEIQNRRAELYSQIEDVMKPFQDQMLRGEISDQKYDAEFENRVGDLEAEMEDLSAELTSLTGNEMTVNETVKPLAAPGTETQYMYAGENSEKRFDAETNSAAEKYSYGRDFKSLIKEVREQNEKAGKVTAKMSDEERTKILSNKVIALTAFADRERAENTSLSKLSEGRQKLSFVKGIMKTVYKEFEAPRKLYNPDMELHVNYSNKNIEESIIKQGRRGYDDLGLLYSCIDDVVANAVGIEAHNRNEEGYKEDRTLNNVYVLFSAFVDGDRIVPVKLEVKEFRDKPNALYLTITTDSIKKDEIIAQGTTKNGVAQYPTSSFRINLTQLLNKINQNDYAFTKYIPAQMKQKEQKSYGRSFGELAAADSKYMNSVERGDMETAQRLVNEAEERSGYNTDSDGEPLSEKQNAYFADSKVRDEEGKLKVMYHGSPNRFTVFDTEKFGGKNGKGEGYGIYFTDDESVAKPYSYGGNLLKGYLNITKPANSWEKTISKKELVKLIRDTCEDEARRMVADGEYDSFENAIKDSWISNYTNTYEKTMKANYDVVADSILENCENDNDIIQEVLNGSGVYSYKDANRFYKVLKDSIGIDGLMTHWKNPETGKESTVALAFNSNQFKNSSNSVPTVNPDIELSYGRGFKDLAAAARPLAAPGITQTGAESAETSQVDNLPTKAREYLNRQENVLLRNVADVLGASKYADRRYMKDVVRQISEEYLKTGRISEESVGRLFDEAYDQARVIDEEWLKQNKSLADYLQRVTLKVNDSLLSNFADSNIWKKEAKKFVKMDANGSDVDAVYLELNEMYPEMFSADIINEADQLERIVDVARDLKRTERTLDGYYGVDSDYYREAQYRDFEAAVYDAAAEFNNVRRYADERAAKENKKQFTDEQILEAYDKLHGLRKAAEKAVNRNLLTDKDNHVVDRLLRGEITMEEVEGMKDINIRGVKKVYEAKANYEEAARVVKEAKKQRKVALKEKAAGLLEDADSWKDKRAGILYMRETAERNIRDIVKNKAEADAIIENYFTPVHAAEAESTRYKNKHRETIKNLNLSRKITEGNKVSESYAVQLVGEAEANIATLEDNRYAKKRDGKTAAEWKAAISEFWEENPNLDKAKIENAIEVFREEYNGMIEDVNKVLVRNGYEPIPYRRGYFPHFEIGQTEGLFAQVKNLLGIDNEVTALPTEINGLTGTFKPGKAWFGNALERMGIQTDYDAVMGFDKYVQGISDVIHQTDNIQNLRALASEARYRTSDEGIRERINAINENDNLTEEQKQDQIAELYDKGKFTLSNFVVWLDEYTNLLANKKSKLDRGIESMFGRDAYNVLKGFEGRIAANMVSFNPGSWLTNFVPLTQAWTTVSTKDMLAGMWDTLKGYNRSDGFVDRSDYLTARFGSENLIKSWDKDPNVKGIKAAGRKYDQFIDWASGGMDIVDNFTSEAIVRARYYQNQRHGMSDSAAMEEANAFAAGLQAARTKGSMPTIFESRNPIVKLFTQFQLEVNNEFSWMFKDVRPELKKDGLAKLAAGLFKFLIGSYIYNEVYEYFVGRRCALDPLGIVNDTVGNATGYQIPNLIELASGTGSFETQKQGTYGTLSELATNVAEELPFVGGLLGGGRLPISSAIPDVAKLAQAATDEDWDAKKRIDTAKKELVKPIAYLAAPGGGSQIKKVAEGHTAVRKGGSYSVDKDGNDILQYPVFTDSAADKAKAMIKTTLFGKSSLKEAREWVDSGFKSENAKNTQFYKDLRKDGMTDREAYDYMKEFSGIKKTDEESANAQKRDFVKESSVPGEVKADTYRMFASDKKKELLDSLSGEDQGKATETLIALDEASKKVEKYREVKSSALTGEGKKKVILSFDENAGEKIKLVGIEDYIDLVVNSDGKKQEDVVKYIKSKTSDVEKQKKLFEAAGYALDGKKNGEVVKDGNFNDKFDIESEPVKQLAAPKAESKTSVKKPDTKLKVPELKVKKLAAP